MRFYKNEPGADAILANFKIIKQIFYRVAAKFHLQNIEDLYFDDFDTNGLFFWLEGVEYIDGTGI